MKPCDPFVRLVIGILVFGRFSTKTEKKRRNRLKGLVSNNVGTCKCTHTDTHTHTPHTFTADVLDFLGFSVLNRYGRTSHSSSKYRVS